jgi:putative hydrolase of HD superfamily
MSNIHKLLQFTEFSHKFQRIKRQIFITGSDAQENDAEHCFQLALWGWYIAASEKLELDQEKIIKYSLAHDLVEIYAGDTFFYSKDQALQDSKQAREQAAAEKIQQEFPEFAELHQLIHSYETLADAEARFVYALDKMIPVINIYLDKGRSWQHDQVTYAMIRTKDAKIAKSAEATKLWEEIIKLLEQHPEYFHAE